MPDLRQMFPRPFLEVGDVCPDRMPRRLTIENVAFHEMKAPTQGGEPEAQFKIKFYEFTKPARLKGAFYDQIAKHLGSWDTDSWIGREIGVYPITILNRGNHLDVFAVVDGDPTALPAGQPQNLGVQMQKLGGMMAAASTPQASVRPGMASLRSAAAAGAMSGRVFGDLAAERLLSHLRGFGKTFMDFHAWVKTKNQTIWTAMCNPGQETMRNAQQWPGEVVQLAKSYLDELADAVKSPTEPVEVINRQTGEVVKPPVRAVEEITEDDIPF